MSNIEFSPPCKPEQITGKIEGPDGYVSSVSLLLRDANGKLFSLHVSTQANQIAELNEFSSPNEQNESLEPVFVVPATTINEQLLDDIVDGIKPEVLSMYLVAQDE